MTDKKKGKIASPTGLAGMRRRIADLEKLDAEHKRLEAALRESQHLLGLVLDAIPARLFWKDRDLKYLGCNLAFAKDAGLGSPEEIIGKSDFDMPWKEQVEICQSDDRKVIDSGVPKLNYEEPLTPPGGGLIWLRTSKIPLLGAAGEIQGVLGTYEDITERKQAEEDLKESQRHFSDIIDFLPDATFVIDREGKVIAWNRAIEEMTGFQAEEMLGKGEREYAIPFYRERRPILIDLLSMPDEVVKTEYASIRREKDVLMGDADCPMMRGEKRFLSGWATLIYNLKGEIVGAIESIRDITDRMHAEEAVHESRRQLAEIIDFLPDATLVIDEEGKVIAWNRAIEEMTGMTAENMLGKGNYEYALPFYGERRPILIDLVFLPHDEIKRKYINLDWKGTTLVGISHIPELKGRHKVVLYGTASILRNSKGQIIGAIESIRDITDRMHAEEAINESRRQLAAIIDFLPDATLVIDKEGKVIAWNRAIEEMTGVKAEDMLGKGDHEYAIPFYGERRPILIDLVGMPSEVLEKKYVSIRREKDILMGDSECPLMRGERRFLSGWASPIYGLKGEIVGAIESIRDVTEQRAMEMSLAAEYQQLSSIMDGSPVSTFVINRDRCVILWNLVCELITGIPKEEVLGKPINLRSLYSNEKAPPTLAELVLEMKDEEILEKHSKRGVCKSTINPEAFETVDAIRIKGEEHIMVIQATRLRNAKGDIVGAIQCAQDMTERKRSEEELQHAKQKLEMWVGELEQRNREVNLLRQMGDLLHACDQFEEAYAVIRQFCPQLFPHAAGAVYTFGESRKAVESVVTWGDSLSSEQVFSPEDCWALRRGQLHVVTPPALGLRCRHVDPSASCDYLGVPMIAAGEISGLLHLEFHENRKCDQRAQEFALIVAEHLSLSLSNLKLRETLRAQSIRDPLTGLFNRRYMEESLEREIPRAVRAHRPVSLVMLDIDHFKRLNDTFGHDAGDSVLKELGALIQKHVREGDIACRFGGEEFILILPDARIEVALQRAENIRAVIKSLNLEHNRQQLGTVTVSLGIATYPDHGKESKVLLHMADEALYQAKKNGRDRVEIAERPEASS